MNKALTSLLAACAASVVLASPIRSNIAAGQGETGNGLPYDSEVEYLEFPKYNSQMSMAFFDIGIVPSLPCKVGGHVSIARLANIQGVVGCGWADNSSLFAPITTYYNPYRLAAGMPRGGMKYFGEYTASGVDVVFETQLDASGNGYSEVNGTVQTWANAFGGKTLTESILIGGGGHIKSNGMPTYTITWGSRVFWVYIQCGDVELDLIPVRIDQTGYLYDRVSGELYGNDGTGEFILGPDVR